MLMRKILFAAVAVASLAVSAGAFAQSGQGGYLGLNPGGQLAAAPSAQPHPSSQQGGYLGVNPGAGLSAPKPADAAEMMANPVAWCRTNSVEPGRCASRALPDHQYCMQQGADHYATCRRAMDFIGWHN
jgi:hypothetical protein